ncbi:hypothetical protein G5I_02994 [Acromyrmex echinatior]|uniref:Uncharacterized protein n=1 Tax=Acromyrmex echinatior TaxID=103372 RepID=F4WBS3_ACREC|nr:hypothetical protein G5I_02994 [Acromyrmex echinatior]
MDDGRSVAERDESRVNQGPSSTRLAVLPSEWLVSAKIGFLRIIRPFSSGGVIGITQTHGTRRLRRAVQPLLIVKKNAACNKGRGAKDEARLIETSAKRSYVPVVYYGSRRLLPNTRCKNYMHALIYDIQNTSRKRWTPYNSTLSLSAPQLLDAIIGDPISNAGRCYLNTGIPFSHLIIQQVLGTGVRCESSEASRLYADVLTDDETSRIGPTSHTMKIRHNLTSRRLSRDKDDRWRVSPPKTMQHVEPEPDHCAQIS